MTEQNEIDTLKAQVKQLQETLDAVNKKCSELVDRAEQQDWRDMWKGPLVPLDALDSSGWGNERFEMRDKAHAINREEHERCALCGSLVDVAASWVWNGIKGINKPYLARCSKSGCKNVRPPFWGDTPEEAVQQWDEAQKAAKEKQDES